MELIDLRKHSLKYKTHSDIETSLAWNAVKKFLENNRKSELFEYISGIKITEKNISLVIPNALVKQEISLYKEPLSVFINENLSEIYSSHTRVLKII